MKKKKDSGPVKRLLRVLDSANGFDLVIMGYRSLKVFKEMVELVEKNCRVRGIVLIEIDLSTLSKVGKFEDLLREKRGREKGRLIFNITGLEKHVKAGRVSSFLNHINLIRDRLSVDFPHGFFFWLPEGLIKRFALDAPDLWAWRNTVLVFEDEEISRKLEGIPIMSNDREDFKNFTLKEKQRQIEYLQEVLETLKKKPPAHSRDKRLAQVYSDLGSLYYLIGEYEKARECVEASLNIRVSLGDQPGIACDYNILGRILEATGNYDSALDYFSKSLQINREIGNKAGEGENLNDISEIYKARGEYNSALKHLQASLKIFQETGKKEGEAETLNIIARIHYNRGKLKTSLKYFEKSLKIHREIGDEAGEGISLNNIGPVYSALGKYDKALECYEKSLKIHRKIGDKMREATTLNNISRVYSARGDYDSELNYLQKSLEIYREIGDKFDMFHVLYNMVPALRNVARVAREKKDFKKFLEYENEAYKFAFKIRDSQEMYNIGRELGEHLCRTGKIEEGIEMLEMSYMIGQRDYLPGVKRIAALIKKYRKSP